MAAQAILTARNLRDSYYSITIEYNNGGKKRKTDTGVKVHEKYWDKTTRKVKANGAANVTETNDKLAAKLKAVNDVVDALTIKNGNIPPTVEQLTNYYQTATETIAAIDTEAPLVTELLKFIEGQKDWALATRKGFITLSNNIVEYQKANKDTWLLSTLTNADIKSWQEWLLARYDYNNATLGKRVRLLRQFLREKPPVNVNLSKIAAIHKQMPTPPVVLNLTEIEAIRALKLEFSPRLERTRDLMIAQIFSGLRFSDLIRLTKQNLQKGHIVIRQQKTRTPVRIPILPQFQEVAAKYTNPETGELELPALSNPKFNKYIKEVCEFVPALREEISIEFKKREKVDSIDVKKASLISSHSSRRSFCSLCLSLNYTVAEVMQWSGHSTLQAFSRYIGLTDLKDGAANDFAARYAAKLAK